MQATTLAGLFENLSFIFIMITILVMITNILVGVRIIPQDKRKKGYKIHRVIYYVVVICYITFLWVNHPSSRNGWFNYAVLVYFLSAIPATRKINITLHAVIASVGLVLLITVVTFGVL